VRAAFQCEKAALAHIFLSALKRMRERGDSDVCVCRPHVEKRNRRTHVLSAQERAYAGGKQHSQDTHLVCR
jgi:hypothetical protein